MVFLWITLMELIKSKFCHRRCLMTLQIVIYHLEYLVHPPQTKWLYRYNLTQCLVIISKYLPFNWLAVFYWLIKIQPTEKIIPIALQRLVICVFWRTVLLYTQKLWVFRKVFSLVIANNYRSLFLDTFKKIFTVTFFVSVHIFLVRFLVALLKNWVKQFRDPVCRSKI